MLTTIETLLAKAVGALLVIVLAFALGFSYRDGQATKEALKAQLTSAQVLESQRTELQGQLDAIALKNQETVKGIQAGAARTVAQLNDAGYRLRIQLADAKVAAVAGNCGREPDGKAELSSGASEFLIGLAARADQQVTGLQDVIRTLQGGKDAKGDHQ